MGGSIESTEVATPALPGFSSRSCVPTAMNFPRTIIVEGWMPTAARPVFFALPYLSLKPPCTWGNEKIGLPPSTSSMNMNSRASSASATGGLISLSQFQSSIPKLSIIFNTLWLLPIRPSWTTRRAPPLTLFVSTRGTFLNAVTSNGSVSTPLTSTGRRIIALNNSSSETLNWKRATSLS